MGRSSTLVASLLVTTWGAAVVGCGGSGSSAGAGDAHDDDTAIATDDASRGDDAAGNDTTGDDAAVVSDVASDVASDATSGDDASSDTNDAGRTYPRPTGKGVYAYETLGIAGFDLKAAMAKVMTLAAKDGVATPTLSLPEGVFEGDGFPESNGVATFLAPDNLSIVGAGPKTILTVKPDSITAAQAAKIPAAGSGVANPLKILLVERGAGTKIAQLTVLGSSQKGYGFSGLSVNYANAPVLTDLWARGIRGSLNSPPGETTAVNVYRGTGAVLTRVETDGRDETGTRVGAAGIELNVTDHVKLIDCYTHHNGFSHGLAIWETNDVETWNFRSEYNGTGGASGGGGGTSGDGLNHERSRRCIHHAPKLGFNSLADVRYYAIPLVASDPYSGDTNGHELHDVVLTDGQPFAIHIDKSQTTLPTITGSPSPVYSHH